MRFGRKGKDSSTQGGGAATTAPKRQTTNYDLGQNTAADGLPGRAGYPNGPRTELPTFFATRRPDGKPEQTYRKKGFFG